MSSVRTLSGFISTGVHSDSDSAPTASSRGSQRPQLPLRVSRALCSSLPREWSPTPKQARPEHASPSRRNSSLRRRNPADVPGDRVGRARFAPSPRTSSDPTDHGRPSVRHRRRAVAPWGSLLRSRSPQPATPRVPPALPAQPPAPPRLPASGWPSRSNPTTLTSLLRAAAGC